MAEIKWKPQAEIDAEREEQEKSESLPNAEERLKAMEDSILYLMMEEV